MTRKKKVKRSLNRRTFLCRLTATMGLYSMHFILSKFCLPIAAIAQDKPPSRPTLDNQTNEKVLSYEAVINSSKGLSERLNANAEKNGRHLTPEQETQQREAIEKTIRSIVESKGYEISAPYNLRIMTPD